MNVLNLDDHLPPEDRDSAALLRREAERVDGGRGPDLDGVLQAGRGRVLRRRLAGLGVAATVVAVAVGLAVGAGTVRQQTAPASPQPEVTVTAVDASPLRHYEDVEAAIADAGIELDGRPRWRSERKVDEGVLWSGFRTETYVPATGSSLLVRSMRTDAVVGPVDENVCAEVRQAFEDAGDEVACEVEQLPEGTLVTVVHRGLVAMTLTSGSSQVHVESDIDTFGVGPQLANPTSVPPEVLRELVTDPRLRW